MMHRWFGSLPFKLSLLAVLVAILAASVLTIIVAQQGGGQDAARRRVKEVPYSFGPTNEVLHVVARQAPSRDLLPNESTTVETWVDRVGERGRQIVRSKSGETIKDVVLLGNRRYDTTGGEHKRAREWIGVDANDPFLLEPEQSLWVIRALYETGHGQLLGKDKVGDREALKVLILLPRRPGVSVTALLDAEMLLPLQEVYSEANQVIGVRVTEYSVTETIPRDKVDGSIFQSPPKEMVYETHRRMNLQQARAFKDFDIYYMGEGFKEQGIFWIQHLRQYKVLPLQVAQMNVVFVDYRPQGVAEPNVGERPQVQVRSERATEVERKEWQQVKRVIQEGVIQGDSENGFRTEFFIANTLITLLGRTQQEVQEMKDAVQKLN